VRKVVFMLFTGIMLLTGSAHSFCFEEAGTRYNINADLLRAIAFVESSFRPHVINRNKNGSYDFGIMQINSGNAGVIGEELWNELGDPCINVLVGSWFLTDCIRRYGYTWNAVGCYNTPEPKKQKKYISKVKQALREIEKIKTIEATYISPH
jgi:soluble lytic murein transglycosylase-like protein